MISFLIVIIMNIFIIHSEKIISNRLIQHYRRTLNDSAERVEFFCAISSEAAAVSEYWLPGAEWNSGPAYNAPESDCMEKCDSQPDVCVGFIRQEIGPASWNKSECRYFDNEGANTLMNSIWYKDLIAIYGENSNAINSYSNSQDFVGCKQLFGNYADYYLTDRFVDPTTTSAERVEFFCAISSEAASVSEYWLTGDEWNSGPAYNAPESDCMEKCDSQPDVCVGFIRQEIGPASWNKSECRYFDNQGANTLMNSIWYKDLIAIYGEDSDAINIYSNSQDFVGCRQLFGNYADYYLTDRFVTPSTSSQTCVLQIPLRGQAITHSGEDNWESCAEKCNNTSECAAWKYATNSSWCWTYKPLPPLNFGEPGYTNDIMFDTSFPYQTFVGYSGFAGVDYEECDVEDICVIENVPINACEIDSSFEVNWEACQSTCSNHDGGWGGPKCLAFTYNSENCEDGKCYCQLFDNVGDEEDCYIGSVVHPGASNEIGNFVGYSGFPGYAMEPGCQMN